MKVNPELIIERVGDEIVVLDSKTSSVWSVSADAARVIRSVLDGEKVSPADDTVASLVERGILVSAERPRVSRRSLVLGSGAAGLGATLALSMPAAANASSPVEENSTITDPPAPPPPALTGGGGVAEWSFGGSTADGVPSGQERYNNVGFRVSKSLIDGFSESNTYILVIEDFEAVKEFTLVSVGDDLVFESDGTSLVLGRAVDEDPIDAELVVVVGGVRSSGTPITLEADY